MKKEGIQNMVDKVISDNLNQGLPIRASQLDLQDRITKFCNVIERDGADLSDTLLIANKDWEKITPTRHRYAAYYICFATKRIVDLDWFSTNRYRFSKFSNYQILKLLQFRDKVSENNSIEMPF